VDRGQEARFPDLGTLVREGAMPHGQEHGGLQH